jgi:TM2 domain-containing membrane protein YozV
MAFCVGCGNKMTDGAAFCGKCGTGTAAQSASPMNANRTIAVVQNQKSSGLAAVLSFFWCGLGQIYNGQIPKGLAMMVCYPAILWFGITMTFFGALAAGAATTSSDQSASGGVVLLGLILLAAGSVLWLFGMINAYRTAERLNREQLVAR